RRPSFARHSSLRALAFFFFFNDPATTELYTLSLHDALPISESAGSSPAHASMIRPAARRSPWCQPGRTWARRSRSAEPRLVRSRSEEHTSELQSQSNLVCRLLLEKKKKYQKYITDSNTMNVI